MAQSNADRNEYVRQYLAKQRRAVQELPELPDVDDRPRRDACIADFELFCKTYGHVEFNLPWSPCHVNSAAKIENAVNGGGWYAWAMPRGGGKTTLCEWAVIWAVLSGKSSYAVIIGATKELALARVEAIKNTLEFNPLLMKDFPHTCIPVACLEGEPRAARGQRYAGKKTKIEWGSDRIVLPWIEHRDHLCAGAVIETYGLTGAIRGLKKSNKDGTSTRPSLIVADDPQTRESAKSPAQTQTRLETLAGDLAYLCGPTHSIAIVCPCTVIYEGDLADKILSRDEYPIWQGERYKMVESFPTNTELWDQYAEIRWAAIKNDRVATAATDFYRENRAKMDEGAVVSWPERYWEDELSGIQHAMNLKLRDEAAFYAECQNEPIIAQADLQLATADEICAKVTGYARGVVPESCSVVTAFTDVQQDHLFWMTRAWAPDFTGYVLDYGTWPDQRRPYFTRREVSAGRHKLSDVYAGDESGILRGALTDLGNSLVDRDYITQDGRQLELMRWCIDGGYCPTPIHSYAVQSDHRLIITITKGVGVGATNQTPFNEAQRAKEWHTEHGHWFWADKPGAARWVRFDANHWKSRVHRGLKLATGSRGAIQLFNAEPQVHRMLADHLLAEKAIKVEAKGRAVFEWKEIPNRDNEGLDCLVGCAVAASIAGIVPDTERVYRNRVTVKTPAEWAAAARGR